MRDELRQVLHKHGYGRVGEHVGRASLEAPEVTPL